MSGIPSLSGVMKKMGHKVDVETPGSESNVGECPPDFVRSELQLRYYREMYHKIDQNGTPTKSVDVYALGMLAINLALIDECLLEISNDGMSVKHQGDRKEVTKKNPAIDLMDKAQAAVRFYLKEFKMTPSSRGKILGNDLGNGNGINTNDGWNDV